MQRAALRIVEAPGFYTDEVELWSPESRGSHSLHYGLFYPDAFPAELPSYFINKYTKRGETVLDPFCGAGTAALEAVINGRAILASDLSPFAIRAARARLMPADITEVTLWLQMVNF